MKKIVSFFILLIATELLHAQAPVISSFSPESAKPGDAVTISGSNFGSTPVDNIVFFGTVRAVVTSASSGTLTATVPPGASCSPISVFNLTNNLSVNSNRSFIPAYAPPKATITTADYDPSFTITASPTSGGPGKICDIDGDGKPDLIVFIPQSAVPPSFSVFRNTSAAGSITFATPVNTICSLGTGNINVGDINGDGKPDIVVSGALNSTYSFASIFVNTSSNGNISFAPKAEIQIAGAEPWAIAIGDLDGDGKPDLVTANGSVANGNSISILRNTGNTATVSFAQGPELSAGSGRPLPRSLAIADIDGDGKADITAGFTFTGYIGVYRNLSSPGNIGFAAKTDFFGNCQVRSITASDVDGDGKTDIIADGQCTNTISILRNTSNPGSVNFTQNNVNISSGLGIFSVAIGDLNGDGKPDFIDANGGANGGGATFNVAVHINSSSSGNISFLPRAEFVIANTSQSILGICDLDGDARPDFATGTLNANNVIIYHYANTLPLHKLFVNDNSLAGDVYTSASGNDANTGSASSPLATITAALSRLQEGDSIIVDAGTYTEQVTITKGITIIGAGQNLTTITNNPAVTLVPPPGTFTEIGLIQTAQNITDVNISNLSVLPAIGSIPYMPHPILIQTGGSVKGCRIMNGGQGIFFRVQYTVKSALIENNSITAEYIGINCEGSGLTTTLLNNTINVTNPGFSAGAFIGADGDGFSPLPQFIATGNFLTSYVTSGFQVYASNATITQNSFLGTGLAIQQSASTNLLTATCNWYGTADANIVVQKISGNINYKPWLSDATDNDVAGGFQPLPGTCTGRQNKFYVNNNSQAGDVFTSAIGNNGNSGIAAAPLASVNTAIDRAQAGDTIYVDAGSYAQQVIINKGITIIGAGQNLTSFTPPAAALVPAPGPFTEIGLIETTQGIGDVHIRNISVNCIDGSAQNIIIQSGGSVRNCALLNGGQGVFFRVESAVKTAVVENNIIFNPFIGVNCQGSGLTATIQNNIITGSTGIFSGVFAGLDFGPLPKLTINNNLISNYGLFSGSGMIVNSNNGSYTLNSITGTGNFAIEKYSGNTPNATCNWFGTSNAAEINSKINGTLNYTPYLTNGTDSDPATGFQPTGNSCDGVPPTIVLNTFSNATCNGASNGSINITTTNGKAPFVYTWIKEGDANFVSHAEDPTNIAAGIYHLTVVDGNGTTIYLNASGVIHHIQVEIAQPAALTAAAGGTNVSCFGANNGTASVLAAGGTVPYTYLWSNNQTTAGISNLVAGIYSVTVTDANGCTATSSYQVTQPPILTASASGSNNLCFGNTAGTATVIAGGGTAPYTYLWSNTQTIASISNLATGAYSVTVTDANGCTATSGYEVTAPELLTATPSGTNVSCFGGNNGTASVLAAGGKLPYTYLWSNGATGSAISNLTAASYSVTTTDANGCTATANYLVTQPPLLTVAMTGTTASCNGSATATAAGGTTPYTYLWSNGATTSSISNVPAGTYTVTVKDANNCTVPGSFTITGNSPINPVATVVNVNCFGGATGTITVTSAGGVAPRAYNLNGSAFQANNVFNNLPAGTYVVGVKDANGCSDFVTKTITQPSAPLVVVLDSMRKTCSGVSDGRIYITPTGGSGTKTYSWTGPNSYTSTVQDPNNVAAGIYSVVVTDSKGCTANLTVTLATWPAVNVSEAITNVACRGESTGAINVTVTGGTGSGFIYAWNAPGTTTLPATANVNALKAGNYILSVTDAGSGCVVQKTIVVNQPATVVNITATNPAAITVCGESTSVTATGSGGTSPYQYSLDGGAYQSAGAFTIFSAGTHTITVSDANGCTKSISKTVTDNGSDLYESNNTKTAAKPISIGAAASARIAIAGDIDWFKFLTPGAGLYTVSVNHPSVNYVINVYGASATALVPVSSTATSKVYNFAGNTTYYVQLTGGLSFDCYSLLVYQGNSFSKAGNTNVVAAATPTVMQATVYPNPHNGAFNLQISSPETAKGTVQLITAEGSIINSREVNLQKGNDNTIEYKGIHQAILFYRVIVNGKSINGKILGAN